MQQLLDFKLYSELHRFQFGCIIWYPCVPSQDAKKPQKAAVKRAVAAAEARAAPETEEHPSKKAKVVEPDGQLPVPDGPGCKKISSGGFRFLQVLKV